MNYAPEDRTVEAAAFIAGGQAKDFGLTEKQGNEFLEDYFNDIVKTNGPAALKRFFSVAPHAVETLQKAKEKYGIQGQTGENNNRAARTGDTGRPATENRTGREGEGVLRPAQPGRSREQSTEARSPRTRESVENSPEFKRWFGKSVVTKSGKAGGEPLVVYHGTGADFDQFSPDKIGTGKGYKSEGGFFFTDSAPLASVISEFSRGVAGANVRPLYLSLKNPLTVDADGVLTSPQKQKAYRRALTEKRDGIIFTGVKLADGSTGREYVAFSPSQIKSAFNRGTFDPNSPNMDTNIVKGHYYG